MKHTFSFLVLLFLCTNLECNQDGDGFIGKNVYLCNIIEGDSITYYKRYVYKKYMELFDSSLITKIAINNPKKIDSIVLQQHNNYNNSDTFNILEISNKNQYVVVLKMNLKVRYKTDEPFDLSNIPVPMNAGVAFVDVHVNDDNPEYHYYTSITGNIYDMLNKKRVYVFSKNEESQDDKDTCTHCIKENIDEIFQDLEDEIRDSRKWREYQKLNHLKLIKR